MKPTEVGWSSMKRSRLYDVYGCEYVGLGVSVMKTKYMLLKGILPEVGHQMYGWAGILQFVSGILGERLNFRLHLRLRFQL